MDLRSLTATVFVTIVFISLVNGTVAADDKSKVEDAQKKVLEKVNEAPAGNKDDTRETRGTIYGKQLDHGVDINPANKPECSYLTMFTIVSSFLILTTTIRS